MRIAGLIILVSLIGCTTFKDLTRERTSSERKVEQNDITTEIFENVQIEIPQNLMLELHRQNQDTVIDTAISKPKQQQEQEKEPVTIQIERTEKTQDSSTTETESESEEIEEEETEREVKGLFGGFGTAFLLGMGLALAGAIYLTIKYVL